MADRLDTDSPPPAATPIAPTNQAVVPSGTVTFAWEPVAEATGYRLEVATDPAFEHVVYEHTLDGTEHTADGLAPAEQTTYYWRVFSRGPAGESHGEVIESFIRLPAHATPAPTDPPEATPAPAYTDPTVPERPDHEEDLGPAPELLKAVTAGAAAEVTGDAEYYAEELAQGVQHEGIGVAQILGFVLAIMAVIALAITFTMQIAFSEVQKTRDRTAAALFYPELRETEAQAAARLTQYEVLDAGEGVYRMPIDEAIEQLVREARTDPGPFSPELQLAPPR